MSIPIQIENNKGEEEHQACSPQYNNVRRGNKTSSQHGQARIIMALCSLNRGGILGKVEHFTKNIGVMWGFW